MSRRLRLPFSDRPRIILAAGVFFTSLSAILIRLSTAPPLAIASYRLIFSVMLLTPLFLREMTSDAGDAPQAPNEAVPARTSAILLSCASGLFLALHFGLWITSLDYTSVASSTVLVTTHPVLVATASALILGERIRLRGVMLIVCAVAGSVLLVAGGLGASDSRGLGNLLAFLGAVAVGGYIILGRIVRRHLSVNVYTMIVYSVTAILLVGAALWFRVALWPYRLREFALFLALALFCTLLGHSLLNWALRYLRPTLVSTSILGEPVIASLLAIAIFGEVPTITTIAGGMVILVSVFLFVRLEADP